MENKIKFFGILVFLLFLSNSLWACSPPQTVYAVKCTLKELKFTDNVACLNSDCDYNVSLEGEVGHQREMLYYPTNGWGANVYRYLSSIYFQPSIGDRPNATRAASFLCNEESSDLSAIFSKYVPEDSYGGSFFTEPYSLEKAPLLNSTKTITGCRYTSYEKIGNWIVGRESYQSYCQSFGGGGGDCSTDSHSIIRLFFYLIQNPSIEVLLSAVPYIVIPLAFFVLLVILTAYFYNTKKLKEFFNPTIGLIVSSITLLLLSYIISGGNFEQAILLTMIYYELFCLARYVLRSFKNT